MLPAVLGDGGTLCRYLWLPPPAPSRTTSTAALSTPPTARPNRSSTRPRARSSPRHRCPKPTDVNRAVESAKNAFEGWSNTTPGERALAMLKLADAIEEHADEIAELESDNAGKPISAFKDDEIPFMVDNLRFFAGAARCLQGPTAGEYTEGYTSMIRREAIGVVGQIAPWNYPLMMAVWKIGPALAAGNTVVLKPSETTPLTALKLAELAGRDLPQGCAQRDHRPRRSSRPGAGHPSRCRHGLADRIGGHRQVDRQARRRHAQASPPRARRQGARGCVRRRRPDDGAGDDRRHRLLQRGPGLHRGDPRAGRFQGPRRRGQRTGRAGPGPGPRRHPLCRYDAGTR